MAFDVIWIKQYLTGGGKNAANISQISRASRAARLGTRTVKLIRLIRMLKILKQMKTLSLDFNHNSHQNKQQQKKKSQRISKIESRITSMRNMELIASIRNMERVNSKRWSIIKNVGFGPEPTPIRVTGKNLLSLSLLPYGNPDTIINQELGSENSNISDKSSKNVSIRQALTNKKVCEEGGYNRDEIVESTNQPMMVPIFEDSCLEGKMSNEDDYNSDKRADYIRYKKTRQELMATSKRPESNIPS